MHYRLFEDGYGRFGPHFLTPMEAGVYLFNNTWAEGFGDSRKVICYRYNADQRLETQWEVIVC
jgi:hypothetical protein